ncbi:MAG TPA: hypothetical protein VMG34_12025 [Bacteroidota bacterium]|nr:hypothetical protein [Bacteroidota bacterium]
MTPIAQEFTSGGINARRFAITSLLFGFLLIPIHELGHVIGDWLTGHPAAMSYARDYLLGPGEKPFLGILGGPLLPLLIALASIVQILRKTNLSFFYPLAILGSIDRLILYVAGMTPSDERDMARMIGWSLNAFKYIFCSFEVAILALVVVSLVRAKLGPRVIILVFVVPLVCFVAGAAFGVLVIERYLFPQQFMIQFG